MTSTIRTMNGSIKVLPAQILKNARRWSVASFWRWWMEGLIAWLPAFVRRRLSDSARRLVILVDGGELVLWHEESGSARELDRQDRSLADWDAWVKRFKSEKFNQLIVRFPHDQILARTVLLPLAAEKNPRQVAGFEMDRLTPFTSAQVYYDVIVLERQTEQRRLRVELVALPRAGVDPILAQLQQRGLPPDVLDVVNGRGGLNLLPPERRVRRGRWGDRLRVVVMVASLLLIAAAVIGPIWQQRLLVISVMTRIAQVQPAANQALTLRDQLDRTLETSQMLAQKKQAVPAKVDLLRELTVILPDDTWVERLQMKGDTVQIIGQSAKASALVAIVESSNLFGGAGFLSPVTTDPRTGKERFVLGVRPGREP